MADAVFVVAFGFQDSSLGIFTGPAVRLPVLININRVMDIAVGIKKRFRSGSDLGRRVSQDCQSEK